MTDHDALRDALAEALDTRVQHYTLSVEPDDSAYMELDPDGRYVIAEEVADAILAHPAVLAALDRVRLLDDFGPVTFGPGCGPFDHPVGCQCPYPVAAVERDRLAALAATPTAPPTAGPLQPYRCAKGCCQSRHPSDVRRAAIPEQDESGA